MVQISNMQVEEQSREAEPKVHDAEKSIAIEEEEILQPCIEEDAGMSDENGEKAPDANNLACDPEHSKPHQDVDTNTNAQLTNNSNLDADGNNLDGNEIGEQQLLGHGSEKQANVAKPEDGQPNLKLFPESIIKRMVKRTLDQISSKIDTKPNPPKKVKPAANAKPKESHVLVVKEANMAINAASCVFVNYIMAMAIEMAVEQKKRTVSREHVLMALCEMDFQDIAVALSGWKHEKGPRTNADDDDIEDNAAEAECEVAKELETAA